MPGSNPSSSSSSPSSSSSSRNLSPQGLGLGPGNNTHHRDHLQNITGYLGLDGMGQGYNQGGYIGGESYIGSVEDDTELENDDNDNPSNDQSGDHDLDSSSDEGSMVVGDGTGD